MDNVTHTREMQGKPRDILRQLPAALGGRQCTVIDDSRVLVAEDDNKHIKLDIEPRDEKHLGSLDLPMLQLRFRFEGYRDDEVEDILESFDVATMRMGGP